MQFKDRLDAAKQLAPLLEKYAGEDGVILAIPRGGVPIGHYLARQLHFPMELLMTKKLGHPQQPEYAIGAVSLEGEFVQRNLNVPAQYIENQVKNIRRKLQSRYKKFMGDRQPVDLKGKTVIIVDDGIATGRTILATLPILRQKQPKRLVVAVPVAPGEVAEMFEEVVDEFVCVHTPEQFFGVGQFYEDFDQVPDGQVVQLVNDSLSMAA